MQETPRLHGRPTIFANAESKRPFSSMLRRFACCTCAQRLRTKQTRKVGARITRRNAPDPSR